MYGHLFCALCFGDQALRQINVELIVLAVDFNKEGVDGRDQDFSIRAIKLEDVVRRRGKHAYDMADCTLLLVNDFKAFEIRPVELIGIELRQGLFFHPD